MPAPRLDRHVSSLVARPGGATRALLVGGSLGGFPFGVQAFEGDLGLGNDRALLALRVVAGVGRASDATLGRGPCGELELSNLGGNHAWTRERIVLLLGQQMPGKDRELARDRDRGDVATATGTDA